jgi:selenide,water dikinase
MTPAYPQIKDLVLIGGGHAHALVLRMWGMDPLPGTRLTVINPGPTAPYTGMLPGLVAGHYRREELMIDLVRLCRFAGARLILDRATGLDREARLIRLEGREALAYDLCSVDVGITSDLPDLPGARTHAVAAKPLDAYAAAWEGFVARRLAFPRVVILGAGLGGVELALASAHRLRAGGARAEVTLVDRAEAILPGLGARARAALQARLAQAGVVLRLGAEVAEIGADHVRLAGGEAIGSDFTLTATGARPQPWLAATGLTDDRGFLVTDATLRTADPLVFAVGDCAGIAGETRPKAGVFAVRAAPVLHANLRAVLTGKPLRPFRPQRDYLKLVSLGGQEALADKWGLTWSGAGLWRLKDRIDRRFMDRLSDLPAMPRAPAPAEATVGLAERLAGRPLCGGCGAKLGPGTLQAALADLPPPARAEVLSGAGDDAAVLAVPGGVQVITTDHLRAFTADARLMARLAALHALGDVWAMGASPQVALAQVALPPLGPDLQARMLAEIMAGAGEALRAAGADVVGGHSTEGAELTIGFTITGTAPRALAKGGGRPGDALVLTRGLGTGVILAAEMARARVEGLMLGEVWSACIAGMGRSQAGAAALLAPVARAMTDVTGFGLAGHLVEMLAASGCGAELWLDAVPLLPGALELSRAGQGSSLLPANLAALAGRWTVPEDPRVPLLADPQTSGGLLAAVPSGEAEGLVEALRQAGYGEAAVVGRLTAGPPHLTVTA